MSLNITYHDQTGNIVTSEKDAVHKVVTDDWNPRIYSEEYRCTTCKGWYDHEIILWIDQDNLLNTETGQPYCEACAPEQPEEE